MDISKIWSPQPGPQVMACVCPADIVFFGGSRGGGKTDCAMGRQVLGAMRNGFKWNGLFVRKNYKHFAELRRRLKELIRFGLPAELKGGDNQTNRLVFNNGAMVLLTAIERPDKLEFFQGQQFCVAKNTRILMADGSGKRIQELKVGDTIRTLEGPKAVTRVMPPREDECVELKNQFGTQVHPLKHPILSAYGWQSYASLMETYSKGTEWNSLESSELPVVKIPAILAGQVLDQASFQTERSSEFCILPEYDLPSMYLSQIFRQSVSLTSLDQRLPAVPVLRSLDRSEVSSCDFSAYVDACDCSSVSVRDFLSGYRYNSRSYDELLPAYREDGLDILPSQACADKSTHGFSRKLLDVQGNIPEYIRLDLPKYVHPYSGKIREVTERNSCGTCLITPCGKCTVYDITVEDANHYISYNTGVVNKNTEISVEEACQFGFIDQMIEQFKGCMRSPHGVECRMFLTGNPGGAGHAQVQARFKLGRIGLENSILPGQFMRDDSGETMVFIPSSVDDNKVLCANDPKYVNRLKSIRDPMLRRAWLEGDWDVIMGGFFTDVWGTKNILPQFRIPKHWQRLVGFDFGSAKPFSVGWYAVASGEFVPELGRALPRGAIVRYFEWYGCVKDSPNTGLRLDSQKIAERMIVLEKQYKLLGYGADVDRIADPAIFKQEDGPSIAEKMAVVGIVWRRGDNQRISGWDAMRSVMRGRVIDTVKVADCDQDDNETRDDLDDSNSSYMPIYEPLFYVTENCDNFIRITPTLERDDHNFEDMDTTQEDHIADECRYVCMARPSAGPRESEMERFQSPMEKEFEQIETQDLDEAADLETPASGDLFSFDDPMIDLARW